MTARKVTPALAAEWSGILEDALATGEKKSNVFKRISDQYGVSFTCVRYHLNPVYRIRSLADQHERYARRKHALRYQKHYHRLLRCPGRYLAKVFGSTAEASTSEIADHVADLTEGVIGERMVQRMVDRYVDEARGPPFLEQAEPGVYRRLDR